jgi:hypothetical protein
MTITLLNPGAVFINILTIESVTPSLAVDKSPITVEFSLSNGTGESTTGWISSNWSSNEVQIQNLPTGQAYHGTLSCTASADGSDTLRLYYTVPVTGIEFPGPVAEADQQVEVAVAYTVSFDSFTIADTRAEHNDTDFAFLAIQVGQGSEPLSQWKHIGDVDNGSHTVGITLGPVIIKPGDSLGIHYQVINHGYNLGDVETFFDDVSHAAAQVLSDIFIGTKWDQADALTQWINSKEFADCDGYCVIDAIGPLDSGRLSQWTAAHGQFTVPASYPQSDLDPASWDKFYATSWPCGTPHYTVYWTVHRVPG